MARFGSSNLTSSQNLSATQDPKGNTIVSSDTEFGASPLGIAARGQILNGLPNGNFDLTCPDINAAVEVDNAIPYWGFESNGDIVTTMVFDATTQNYSVRLDPNGAASGDSVILKTRTYLLNDDALALRQKAFASLTRQGTNATSQWAIVLSATYFDEANTQLSSFNIGTAADTGTWTGINGVTTSGSAAISASAAYADIALTLTASGSVSGTAQVDINSVLLANSQATTGSFVVTETFLTSGTFTRPTGVEFVTVAAMGGGAGGKGGNLVAQNSTVQIITSGGDGGASGPWVLLRDLYVGDVATVSVGIGAGGAGGTATAFSKAALGAGTATQTGGAGGAGGATTFSTYLTVGGGVTTGSSTFYGLVKENGKNGGNGGSINPQAGSAHTVSAFTAAPFSVPWVSTGSAGVAGTGSGGSSGTAGAGGTANASLGIGGSGGGGGGSQVTTTADAAAGAAGGAAGSGSGGGASSRRITATSTVVATGGAGGTAIANTGAAGGGGGSSQVGATTAYSASTLTLTSGAGGAGGSGWLVVAYTA